MLPPRLQKSRAPRECRTAATAMTRSRVGRTVFRASRTTESAMQRLATAGLFFALGCARAFAADAPPNLEGVWGMVQHDRLGAPFFIPIEPKYTDEGKRITS